MDKPQRKTVRLKSWDYSSNASYHVTICSAEKKPVFGSVECGPSVSLVLLNDIGEACEAAILEANDNVSGLSIDNYVIMPNHVHLLLSLRDGCDLGRVIARIKSKALRVVRSTGRYFEVWQRGYHEHIIRGEADYQSTWEYIDANPARWLEDELYVR